MQFSVIVPVYNRPEEIREFLGSVAVAEGSDMLEIIIVEDGSGVPCDRVIGEFSDKLHIRYFFKANTGPGDSRNFGMREASHDYFIIFDSDCIIPPGYFSEVRRELNSEFVDCFGGPDAAHDSFSDTQKAINFAMTSSLTTGGVRGGYFKSFQPRSFNMGLSRKAFEFSGGFGNIHPGEDPDLVLRLWKSGLRSRLFPQAYVFHKRRIDWQRFRIQVSKFGKARPILNKWHPEYVKATYFAPSVFVVGFYFSLLVAAAQIPHFIALYILYFLLVFMASSYKNGMRIGWMSVVAVWVQFFGYGHGYILSWFRLNILRQSPEQAFPELFFRR